MVTTFGDILEEVAPGLGELHERLVEAADALDSAPDDDPRPFLAYTRAYYEFVEAVRGERG